MNTTIIYKDDGTQYVNDMTAHVTKEGLEKIIEILTDEAYIIGVKIKYPDVYDSSSCICAANLFAVNPDGRCAGCGMRRG